MKRFICLTAFIFVHLSAASLDPVCSATIAHSSGTVSSNTCGSLVHPLGASVILFVESDQLVSRVGVNAYGGSGGPPLSETFFVTGSIAGNAVLPAKTLEVPGPAGTGLVDYYFHVAHSIASEGLLGLEELNITQGPLFAAIDGASVPAIKVGEYDILGLGLAEVYRIRTPFQYNTPFELSTYFPASITFDGQVPTGEALFAYVRVYDVTGPPFSERFPIGIVVVPEPATVFLVWAGAVLVLLAAPRDWKGVRK